MNYLRKRNAGKDFGNTPATRPNVMGALKNGFWEKVLLAAAAFAGAYPMRWCSAEKLGDECGMSRFRVHKNPVCCDVACFT